MAYCTIAQLTARYSAAFLIELSFRGDTAPTEPDADLFARAIADAGALIDGFLKARYALPIAGEVPPLLIDLAQRVAIYNAHANVAGDKIRKDYDDAIKLLGQIGSGTVRLDIAGAEPAGSGAQGVRITDRDRPFTADNLKGYI